MEKVMVKLNSYVIFCTVLLLLLGAIGCSESSLEEQSQQVIAGGGDVPEIRVTAAAPTDVSVLGNLDIGVERGEAGFDVMVSTGDMVIDTGEIFLNIEYDPAANHALGLDVDAAAIDGDIIGLAIEPDCGVIDFGVVTINPEPAVVDDGGGDDVADAGGNPGLPEDGPTPWDGGDDEDDEWDGRDPDQTVGFAAGTPLLSFKLIPGASDRIASSIDTKQTSGVSQSNMSRARNLHFSQNEESAWVLSWDYTNPGDGNQDGLVSANDLTPIGQNYLAKVSNDWNDPLRNVDGNHDGEINVSDITAIGQNYTCELHSYKIEMSEDGEAEFITVGELTLGDVDTTPGQAARFEYTFGAQYVEGAWYRVRAMDRDLNLGPASEMISEAGRRMNAIEVKPNQTLTISVAVTDLPYSIAHLNSVRVVYPDTFHYVPESANAGKIGNSRGNPDGIWSSFVEGMIFPDDFFFLEESVGDGKLAIAFNVTTLMRTTPGAPVGYGDLVNFKLQSDGSEPLTLEFQEVCADGMDRTYYTDGDGNEHYFGNNIGFRIQ